MKISEVYRELAKVIGKVKGAAMENKFADQLKKLLIGTQCTSPAPRHQNLP